MRRNLIYYMHPVKGSIWEWNLQQIKRYWSSFNGKKIFVLAVNDTTEPLEKVVDALPGEDATIIASENDPNLREASTFISSLEEVRSLDSSEATFYAHAKGVTREAGMIRNVCAWVEVMCFLNLGDVEIIDRILSAYSAAGCFRQTLDFHGSRWHFSGAFFWFKHSTVFARDWRFIQASQYGVEAYLGRHLSVEESFNLTEDRNRHFTELYSGSIVTMDDCLRWKAGALSRISTLARA